MSTSRNIIHHLTKACTPFDISKNHVYNLEAILNTVLRFLAPAACISTPNCHVAMARTLNPANYSIAAYKSRYQLHRTQPWNSITTKPLRTSTTSTNTPLRPLSPSTT